MSTRSDQLLQLARQIVAVEKELSRLRREFARLSGDAQLEFPVETVEPPRGFVAPQRLAEWAPVAPAVTSALVEQVRDSRPSIVRAGPSLMKRIQDVLDMNPRPLATPEILMLLESHDHVDSVRAALSKLVQRGTIARVRHGLYQSTLSAPERRGIGGR